MSDPLELFPEEVWKIILDCVDDAQNVLSCSRTCTLFKRVFSPTQTTWGFSLIFPSLLQFLPISDVLHCRVVSKSWLNGVDTFLQSENYAPTLTQQLRSHTQNLDSSFVTRIPKRQRINIYQPGGYVFVRDIQRIARVVPTGPQLAELIDYQYLENDLQRWNPIRREGVLVPQVPSFASAFENNIKDNPFPSKAVVFTVINETTQSMIELLNKFGHHIWSLNLLLKTSGLSRLEQLELIWSILKCVPNLKRLLIQECVEFLSRPFHENHFQVFGRFLENTTTPPLEQLMWIELDIKFRPIRDILIKVYSSRSVTIFEVMGYIKPHHLSSDWKHLSLKLERGSLLADSKWLSRSFKHLNLPLESIHIEYSKCEDFESIFDSLSKYGSTLGQLTLIFSNLQREELVEMGKRMDAIYTCFLSLMKDLENFTMIVDCADSTIEFCKFVDGILDAEWIEKYLEMGGVISGFRRFGFACISAGMRKKAEGSNKLKRKYFTNGKHFRSMEVVPQESN